MAYEFYQLKENNLPHKITWGQNLQETIQKTFNIANYNENIRDFAVYEKLRQTTDGSMRGKSAETYSQIGQETRFPMYESVVKDALKLSDYKGGTILDIGCGPGIITNLVAQKVKPNLVIGFDPSPEMVKFAAQAAQKQNIKNASFCFGRAEAIPLQSETINLLITRHILGRIKDTEQVLIEMLRLVKKDGTLYFREINRLGSFDIMRKSLIDRPIEQQIDLLSTVPALYTSRELKNKLLNIGLEENQIKIIEPAFMNNESKKADLITELDFVVLVKKR